MLKIMKMMKSSSGDVFFVCVLVLSWLFCLVKAGLPVIVEVGTVTSIARTDENFICATLDWWPETKCDYGQCPWGKAGILNLDLENQILANAIKAFSPLRIRVGGSLEDRIVYQIGNVRKCPHLRRSETGMFGFTKGCLTMERWDQLNALFNKTGALVTFGLNALIGRKKAVNDDILWVGNWGSQNARDFIEYTVNHGYRIHSYELGNELSGSGVAARVEPDQYGKDMVELKNIVTQLYSNKTSTVPWPLVLGPGGFYNEEWFNTFLQTSGPGVVDGVTHHTYNLGAGVDENLISKVRDPYFLHEIAQTYKDVSTSVDLFGPWAGAWVGESGGAFNSGGKNVSNTFANGFWYLDQLGMTSTFNHKVFCRQSLIGGNYGLLNTTSFVPNPDFYGALLWHRLMGERVLATTHHGSPSLRAYSHCSKNDTGITVLLINLSNSTGFQVSVVNDLNLYSPRKLLDFDTSPEPREEYHLTPQNGDIKSDVVLLNGTPLNLTESLEIPALLPKYVGAFLPILVKPDSIVFVKLKGLRAPACA